VKKSVSLSKSSCCKPEEDSDKSVSSEELDPDKMNKDDYFKALKKKQRKNFVFSLRKDAETRN